MTTENYITKCYKEYLNSIRYELPKMDIEELNEDETSRMQARKYNQTLKLANLQIRLDVLKTMTKVLNLRTETN